MKTLAFMDLREVIVHFVENEMYEDAGDIDDRIREMYASYEEDGPHGISLILFHESCNHSDREV